jgi:hypothetical protein
MPPRSWSASPDGRTAPLSSGLTATLLTIASSAGVGVERVADQVVDDAGTVVLGRVNVIDSGGDRGPEHALADARSGGVPKANGPASCIALYPGRLTCIWPSAKGCSRGSTLHKHNHRN